jgi:hypothetical protein
VHEERYERTLAPFTGHLLTAAAIGPADRVYPAPPPGSAPAAPTVIATIFSLPRTSQSVNTF